MSLSVYWSYSSPFIEQKTIDLSLIECSVLVGSNEDLAVANSIEILHRLLEPDLKKGVIWIADIYNDLMPLYRERLQRIMKLAEQESQIEVLQSVKRVLLGYGYAHQGKWDEARHQLRELANPGIEVLLSSFNILASGIESEKLNPAAEVVAELLQAANLLILDPNLSEGAWGYIRKNLCQSVKKAPVWGLGSNGTENSVKD